MSAATPEMAAVDPPKERPRLTLATVALMVAVLAPYLAFARLIERRVSGLDVAVRIVLLSLSAALPALWFGAWRRLALPALLARLLAGGGFVLGFWVLMVEDAVFLAWFLQIVGPALLLVASVCWYVIAVNGPERDRRWLRRAVDGLATVSGQLALSYLLLILFLDWILA